MGMGISIETARRSPTPSPRLRGEGWGEGPFVERCTLFPVPFLYLKTALRRRPPLTLTLSPQAGRGDLGLPADA